MFLRNAAPESKGKTRFTGHFFKAFHFSSSKLRKRNDRVTSAAAASHGLRSQTGNMIVLSVACTLGILAIIGFFGLGYVRLLGSHSEQRTAIESAAMTAAMDMSRIVINTPEYGYVGLSDAAPSGSYTDPVGGDGYSNSVHSINTLLGTARLDLMIASVIPNIQGNNSSTPEPVMTALALKDLQKTYSVQTQLQNALLDAVKPNPAKTYYDNQGVQVNVYQDALAAYQKNPSRMTGKGGYANGTLNLSLGYLSKGMVTNVNVPLGAPNSLPALTSSQQANNCYKAYVNCPFGGQDFYFAGIGDSVRLVDKKDWVANLSNLPNTLPTPPLACIVKAEADNNLKAGSNSMSDTTLHAMACAAPANVYDPKPHPGIMTISFPDGQVFDFTSMADLFSDPQMNKNSNQTTCYTSPNGDYPTDPSTSLTPNPGGWPLASPASPSNGQAGPCAADYCKLAFYDWIRRAGTQANITAVQQIYTHPFDAPGADINWNVPFVDGGAPQYVCKIARGIIHVYTWNNDGSCTYSSASCFPMSYNVVSQNQLYSESIKGAGGFFTSTKPANMGAGPATASYNTISYSGINIPDSDDEKPKGQRQNKTQTSGTLTFLNTFDCYVIDECRVLGNGPANGGIHSGEPCDVNYVAGGNNLAQGNNNNNGNNGNHWGQWNWWNNNWNNGHNNWSNYFFNNTKAITLGPANQTNHGGQAQAGNQASGDAPLLAIVSDFAEDYTNNTTYNDYSTGPGGASPRPTYAANGLVADIRFRRDIQVTGSLAATLGFKMGYLAEEDPPY